MLKIPRDVSKSDPKKSLRGSNFDTGHLPGKLANVRTPELAGGAN